MQTTMFALLPGIFATAYFFGWGIFSNMTICIFTAVVVEAIMLKMRAKDLISLKDGSAVLTALLLGVALPPYLPTEMLIIGTASAIIFGKHLYGGLGHNPFNPAMVGYAILIVSFPLAMSTWPLAQNDIFGSTKYEPTAAETIINEPSFDGIPFDGIAFDGKTAATPLDTLKFRGAKTIQEAWTAENGFSILAGTGWQSINIAFMLGGLVLIYFRIAHWQACFTMLLSLSLLAAIFYDGGGSASLGSPAFHLFSGGTMLVAFFMVTDPVTAPEGNTGLFIYGAGIGVITFIIRSLGGYPDGMAFAILLMNAMTPLIDQFSVDHR